MKFGTRFNTFPIFGFQWSLNQTQTLGTFFPEFRNFYFLGQNNYYLLMLQEFPIPIAMYTSCSCVGRPRLYTRVTSKSKHHSKRYIRKPRKISTLNHRSHVAGPAKGRRVARARPAANHRTPEGSNDTAQLRTCHIANAPANREPRRRPATHAGGRISLLAAARQAVKQATSQLL